MQLIIIPVIETAYTRLLPVYCQASAPRPPVCWYIIQKIAMIRQISRYTFFSLLRSVSFAIVLSFIFPSLRNFPVYCPDCVSAGILLA